MKKILLFLLFVAQGILAQSSNELFVKANDQYKQELYSEAIVTYNQIEALGLISSQLYYNLGNCYYKLNKVAPSIYNYEKALLIDPLNEDAENNLVFAKRLTIDNIEELPKSLFQKIDESFVKKLSYNEWSIVSVVFSILGVLLFLLFYFSYTSSKKRLFFVTSIISFLLVIASSIFAIKEHSFQQNNISAIIFAQEVEIKNAPTLNSENIFTLHEGTKVSVLDTVDNWKKIRIADGKIGWILFDKIKLLNIF
ncbi:MAG: SH3 domain-containing protein [Flavobacteriaceae bacterium]